MRQPEFLDIVARALESEGVAHFVTGSVASTYYGEPRFTIDIDIVVELKLDHVPRLRRHFPEEDYYFSEEAAARVALGGGMFNIIHSRSGLKVDLIVPPRDAYNFVRRGRVREVTILEGVRVRMSSPEDVIVSKLLFFRQGQSEKHLRDIAGILRAGREALDMDYVRHWVEHFDLGDIWTALLKCRGQDSH